jgi:hypothetical protein
MSLRLLGVLQWVGLLLGAAVWIAQHAAGSGITQAECGAGGAGWGISNDLWQGLVMGVAAGLVLLAEAAALAVFSQTRGADFGDGPAGEGRFNGALPYTRIHFFATAAIAANALFLMIILLDGFASIFNITCRQS